MCMIAYLLRFIFRFNIAPTWGYESDVGNRTDATTWNPSFVQKL